MHRSINILPSLLWLLLLLCSCKESFEPPAVTIDYNFLVVEGIINTGNAASTIIHLSRTKTINDSSVYSPETGASVLIESEAGNQYHLSEQADGSYASALLNLNSNAKHRLKITTADQQQYVSDYTTAKVAPDIDSVTWQQDKDVTIFVHTHDPTRQSQYYQWEFVDTWEYDSELETAWGVSNGMAYPLDPIDQVHTCWINGHSTDILIGTSTKLNEDLVSYEPIAVIPIGSKKILKRYSILVKQYALSREAFEYWDLIKKNTEKLGTLFDAQPTQLSGNIHHATNPLQPVIGFISAGVPKEKRIYIDKSELNNWVNTEPAPDCYIKTIAQDPNNILVYNYPDPTYTVYYFVTGGIVISKVICVDCRTQGGSNKKPSFW